MPSDRQNSTTPSEELITGAVERVTFHNEENGYCVLRVKVKGHRDLVTVVGHAASVTAGEFVEAQGNWTNHREFGVQFIARALKTVHPTTLEGIERYLGSGMVKGIGPHFAKKLVAAFGKEVFDVIEKDPQSLAKVPGIGAVRIQKITSAWTDQKSIREIMVFLQSHGVATGRAVRIFKTYGQSAIEKVRENPYRLARDIQGIGFKSADQIATRLGIAKDSLIRARAGMNYALMEVVGQGHCAYPEEALLKNAEKLLEIERPILQQAIEKEVNEKFLIREDIHGETCLFPAGVHWCESQIAHLLTSRVSGEPPWGKILADKALQWVQEKLNFTLADLQKEAIRQALVSKVFVMTGGPGTGKTTLTRSLVTILRAKQMEIALCSPTGRAAKRLSECTGMEAKTIHRLLKYDVKKGGFSFDEKNPLSCDLLLLDEASMVDVHLLYSLLKAVPKHAAFILVGDVDQIPSVGPGCILEAILQSSVIPTVRLTQIFRQAAESQIVANAHRINEGRMPEVSEGGKNSDFYFMESDTPEKTIPRIVELVKERIPRKFGFDSVKDIQVLCPMNRAGLGARALNVELQKALNPSPEIKIQRFGSTFSPGDKVMVTTNDYDKEVFNGDIGFIRSLDLPEQEAVVEIDGREVVFDFGEMDILSLAYATSIHKSQGSEYPAVVIPVSMQHYLMLKRNLLYTGVTRGKKLVVLIGQKKAIAMAIRSASQEKRWNKLAQRLRELSSFGNEDSAALDL